jgi:hypothetical protein
MENGTQTKVDNCDRYIIPDIINLGKHQDYCRTFKADKPFKTFVRPNKTIDGVNNLQKIGFHFYLNKTAAEEESIGIASLSIKLASPG